MENGIVPEHGFTTKTKKSGDYRCTPQRTKDQTVKEKKIGEKPCKALGTEGRKALTLAYSQENDQKFEL